MSFNISLYKNDSPPNYMNKELTLIATLTGTLRGSSSIIDPIVRIEANTQQIGLVNYIDIPVFGRKYFIKNIVSVRNSIWELYCHVDVLGSWKAQLLANGTGVVKRQEMQYNLYLDDGIFKAYQDPIIQTLYFPSGFSSPEFVLAVAGSAATANASESEPGGNVSV